MAGPVIQLHANHFDKAHIAAINKLFERHTLLDIDEQDKKEFCFKKGKTLGLNLKETSCTFLYHIDCKEENDELEAQYLAALKQQPVAFINISAMCNDDSDHYLLAAFAIEINKIVGGYIDLNGQIVAPLLKDNNGKFIMHTHQDEINYVQSIKGEIHEMHYDETDIGGRAGYFHVIDAVWLANWMNHDDFRLIK
jgi:Family of unknown function (DUF6368)